MEWSRIDPETVVLARFFFRDPHVLSRMEIDCPVRMCSAMLQCISGIARTVSRRGCGPASTFNARSACKPDASDHSSMPEWV